MRPRSASAAVLLLLFAVAAMAEPDPEATGRFAFEDVAQTPPRTIQVWYYRPPVIERGTKIVFLMHGIGRTGKELRDLAVPLAANAKVIALVPEFSAKDYPGNSYARGDLITSTGERRRPDLTAFGVIERIFDFARKSFAVEALQYDIVGFSAGGQFVQTMVLFAPGSRFRTAVACTPGEYTLPSDQADSATLQRAFSRRLVLVLGDNDVTDKPREAAVMAQGANRFTRGLRFFAASLERAQRDRVTFAWRLRIVPDVAHDPVAMYTAGWRELDTVISR